MLYLAVRPNQAIQIGDNIIVSATARNGRVMPIKFGIDAPREIKVQVIEKPRRTQKGHDDFIKDIKDKEET